MQCLLILLFMSMLCAPAFAQHVYKIKTDSLLVTNDSCNAEFIIENESKFVNGFLYNKGKGRTIFKQAMVKLNDSMYVFGGDTLNFRNLLNTIGFSGSNIYNSNGTLTSDRSLTLGSFSLSFKNGNNTIEHTFANGNKWLGNGTPTDYGSRLVVDGSFYLNGNLRIPYSGYRQIWLNSQYNGQDILIDNSGNIKIGPSGDALSGGAYGMGYIPVSGSQGFAFYSSGNSNYSSATLQIFDNTVQFGTSYNFAGNISKKVVAKFTSLNNWQLVPELPTAYTAGVNILIKSGNGGNWSGADNYGLPGKLILEAGDAQNTSNNLNNTGADIEVNSGRGTGSGTGGDILFSTSTALSSGTTSQSLNERLRVKFNTGNVLIGTSNDAGHKLDVNGSGRFFASSNVLRSESSSAYTNLLTTNGSYWGGQVNITTEGRVEITNGYNNDYIIKASNTNGGNGITKWLKFTETYGGLTNLSNIRLSNGGTGDIDLIHRHTYFGQTTGFLAGLNIADVTGNQNFTVTMGITESQFHSSTFNTPAFSIETSNEVRLRSPYQGTSGLGITSGVYNNFRVSTLFAPTSGTGIYNGIVIDNTINQSGGANGFTRGLYINPTLTSVSQYRAIEVVTGNTILGSTSGKVGVGTTSPTSSVDINGTTGHSQFRLRTSYTPTSTSDTNGNVGDFSWDDNYFYIKTSAGWKRSALSTF